MHKTGPAQLHTRGAMAMCRVLVGALALVVCLAATLAAQPRDGDELAARLLQEADRLVQGGRALWGRSTIGLTEYAYCLNTATYARTQARLVQRDAGAYQQELRKQHHAWQEAVEHLARFPFPAAPGLQGDLELARYWEARARADLASGSMDAAAQRAALAEARAHATALREARQNDVAVGLAELPALALAASLEGEVRVLLGQLDRDQRAVSAAMDDQLVVMEHVLNETARLHGAGAELGRDDRLAWARYWRDNTLAARAALEGKKEQSAGLFDRCAQHAQQMFQARRRYYETGTSTPYELAEASMLWVSAQLEAARLRDQTEQSARAWEAHARRLEELLARAAELRRAGDDGPRTHLTELWQTMALAARLELRTQPPMPTPSAKPRRTRPKIVERPR